MKTVAKWNTLYRDNKGEKMTESHIKLKALSSYGSVKAKSTIPAAARP